MKLQQLKFSVAVADCLSFRQAAEKCNVSQPSLSVGVKNLEYRLGVVLFDRCQGGSVEVTAKGAALIAQARLIVQACQDMRDMAKGKPVRQAQALCVVLH